MKNLKLSLICIFVCLSLSVQAKSLTDILIDGIASKIEEKINPNKTITPPAQNKPIAQEIKKVITNDDWAKESECNGDGVCTINNVSPNKDFLIKSICRNSNHCDIVVLSKSSQQSTLIMDDLPEDLLGRVSVSWLDNSVAKIYLSTGSNSGGALYFNGNNSQVVGPYERPLTEVSDPYGNGYYLAGMEFRKNKPVIAVYDMFPCQKTDKPFALVGLPNASPVAHDGLIEEAELYFQKIGREEDDNVQLRIRVQYMVGANYKTGKIDVAVKTPEHNCSQ